MDKGSKTCLTLTVAFLIGLGIAESLHLEILLFVCFFGVIISGIATLVAVFNKEEDHDDTTDSDVPE